MIYARKLNLDSSVKQELFENARHIANTISFLDSSLHEADSWCFMDYAPTEWKFFCDYLPFGGSIRVEPMEQVVRYEQLKKTHPEFLSFFDKFGLCHMYLHLQHDIERTLDGNSPEIHRHAYDETSSWNLVLFDKNVEGSIVKFFSVDDPEFSELPAESKYYENLPRTVDVKQTHELTIHAGDVYAFNVPQWHTFIPARSSGRYSVHFMHLKGAIDLETAERACRRIEGVSAQTES